MHSALPVPLAEALDHRADRVVDTLLTGMRKLKGGSGGVVPINLSRARSSDWRGSNAKQWELKTASEQAFRAFRLVGDAGQIGS